MCEFHLCTTIFHVLNVLMKIVLKKEKKTPGIITVGMFQQKELRAI
jgi:hypothetical protein